MFICSCIVVMAGGSAVIDFLYIEKIYAGGDGERQRCDKERDKVAGNSTGLGLVTRSACSVHVPILLSICRPIGVVDVLLDVLLV
jgi:hypothetical protein